MILNPCEGVSRLQRRKTAQNGDIFRSGNWKVIDVSAVLGH